MDSGLLSLKWNNHSSTFFHVLETIRRKELYSDVTIACDGKFFSVHKLVLSTCSEYFQEMFERTQCKHPVIVLKDINYKDLESLLNYMYIGEVNVIQTELSSLIKAAECLKVKGLAVPDEPPQATRKSSKRQNYSERDDGSVSKRNRRSSSHGSSFQTTSQPTVVDGERMGSDSLPVLSSPSHNPESNDRETPNTDRISLPAPEQPSSENYKEFIPVVVKSEKEDSPEPFVENRIPPVSKFEYDGSPVGSNMSSGLEEGNDSTSFASHLQQPPTEESMSHLMPSTSRFHGESSSWPGGEMENIEDGDKEGGGGEGPGSFDPNTFPFDSSQAKAQMAFGERDEAQRRENNKSLFFMRKEGSLWKCKYKLCDYSSPDKCKVTTHVRKHTGERPYWCSFCNYRANQSSNLYTHLKKYHMQESTSARERFWQ